jgi:hypothetical protein
LEQLEQVKDQRKLVAATVTTAPVTTASATITAATVTAATVTYVSDSSYLSD